MKITEVYGDLFSKFHILVRVFANTFCLVAQIIMNPFLKLLFFWDVMQHKAVKNHSLNEVLSNNISQTEVLSKEVLPNKNNLTEVISNNSSLIKVLKNKNSLIEVMSHNKGLTEVLTNNKT
jgi:hypothetical protein